MWHTLNETEDFYRNNNPLNHSTEEDNIVKEAQRKDDEDRKIKEERCLSINERRDLQRLQNFLFKAL